MKLLDIGEVAAASGLRASTLRYYEELGLIEAVGRRGLRRQYEEVTVLRLALIALAKAAGFSLAQIRGMFAGAGQPRLPHAALRARADELDVQIAKLSALRDSLRHAADCPAPSHLECPKFQQLLRQASWH